MIFSLVALALSFATGWCLLHLVGGAFRLPLAVRLSLAAGVGTFASSLLYLVVLATGMSSLGVVGSLDLVLLIVAFALFARVRPEVDDAVGSSEGIGRGWPVAIGIAGALQFVASVARYRGEPLGFWDAFAIWNLKARFFFLEGGDRFEQAFSDIITWSHTDYPTLLPGGVARLWTYADQAATTSSALYSLVFYVMTAVLVFGALDRLAGRRAAVLGGLALLATPAYAGQSVWQVADIPLSFALLATLTLLLLALRDEWAGLSLVRLAGFFAGVGALTKNEGLLFAVAIFAVLFVASRLRSFSGEPGWWIAYSKGAALPLLILLVMKLGYGGESDLAADFGVHSLARIAELERHVTIAISFVRSGLTLTGLPLFVVLLVAAIAIRIARPTPPAAGAALAALVLTIQLLGYYGVYLITERDLAWHLGTSNLRLFVQLWPSALLLYFALLFNEARERGDQTSSRLA